MLVCSTDRKSERMYTNRKEMLRGTDSKIISKIVHVLKKNVLSFNKNEKQVA